MSKFKVYLKSILVPVILGGIVGIFISQFMDYGSLNKPPFAPPGIVFPIVWTILYVLMGVSYGILKYNNLVDEKIDRIYYLQLFVNLLWPIFFFAFKWRLFSIIWIILLVVLVATMIYRFYQKNKASALIQIPYLLWTIFATYLNIGFYLLNK